MCHFVGPAMQLGVIAVTLWGCGGTVAPVASTPQVAPRGTPPPRLRVPADIVPGELADPGVMDRITKRARVRVMGRAWLTLGGATIEPSDATPPSGPLSVIAETREHIRVISEDDSARVAVWIPRGDALLAPTVEVQLTDERGLAPSDVGVWLEPGAKVDTRRAAQGRREVTVTTDALNVAGWVPASVLGAVWTVAPVVKVVPTHALGAVELRAAPTADAAVIARTLDETNVVASEARGAWRLVVLRRDGLRIRGWVPERALESPVIGDWGTIGLGNYYTSSHSVKIDVPPGTCLFADVDREVVGVQVKLKTRQGSPAEDGWMRVMMGTPWGMRNVYLHTTAGGALESCLP